MNIKEEINTYKILLKQTDYQSLKHADGALTDEEYEPIRIQRAEWRQHINEIELLTEDLTEEDSEEDSE